jgi:LuxR family maltose regulon positive regulatory protein
VLYEWDELEQAVSQFRAGLALNERSGDLGLWVRCQIGLARALHVSGRVDEAQALLDQLEHFARTTTTSNHNLAALAWAVCVPLWVTQGATEKLAWWLDECGPMLDAMPDTIGYSLEARYIYLAQALLAQGRIQDALSLLGRLCIFFVATDRRHRVVRVLALQALALHAQGQDAKALAILAEALAVGEPGGYIRTFLDDGAPMLALLAKLARAGRKRHDDTCAKASRSYVRKLLIAGGHSQAPVHAQKPSRRRATNELLSGREQEILRHVAAGRSNTEIARELVLELSTVKWHLKTIYSKLDVRRRSQAVAQAREFGVL